MSRMPLNHPNLPAALQDAASAMGRLDQALEAHPLLPAFLHRARLEAVRRQAAVDGHAIDPWHLVAIIEGLRLRLDGTLRIIDRGAIFEAGRIALDYYGWVCTPNFVQEGEVQDAERHLMPGDKPPRCWAEPCSSAAGSTLAALVPQSGLR